MFFFLLYAKLRFGAGRTMESCKSQATTGSGYALHSARAWPKHTAEVVVQYCSTTNTAHSRTSPSLQHYYHTQ